MLSRTIMGLLPSTAVLSGSVRFAGQEILGLDARQLRHLWGREMSMVFQNPMVSLNPLMRVGHQIAEPLEIHLGMDRGAGALLCLKAPADRVGGKSLPSKPSRVTIV